MSTTPPPAAEQDHPPVPAEDPGPDRPAGPRITASDARALSRLRRSRTDRRIAGVSGGLGRHLDVDPTIIRVAFVALALFGGAGLLLYAVGWLLVPEEGSDRARLDVEPGLRTVVLVVLGVLAAISLLGGWWDFPWPLAVVGLVVVAVAARRSSRRSAAASSPSEAGGRVSLDKEHPAPGWVGQPPPPAPPAWGAQWAPPPAPPTPPRRRGPSLVLPTLALIVVGWGVLWAVDLGREIPSTAYAALALAVCGLVLVISAWFGRGGGVVVVGLLAALGLAVTAVAQGGVGEREVRPLAGADLAGSYRLGVGALRVDLTEVADPRTLDGRTLRLDADLGQIVVDLPEGLDVVATATADGGQVDVFGRSAEGDHPSVTQEQDGGADAPRLVIEASVDYGQITVRTN